MDASRSCSTWGACCARSHDASDCLSKRAEARRYPMLTSFNIGKRMGLAFATLVGLALALAATGYWGLHTIAGTAEQILAVDVVAADTSGQVQASTLGLRRFEKD